jgi:hypothetical protein
MNSPLDPVVSNSPNFNSHSGITIAILVLLALLSTCLTLACAVQAVEPLSYLPDGFVVHACIGTTGQGSFRAGFWWLSPYVRDVPRWAFVTPTFPSCAYLPWLPFLPQYGNAMFP